MKIGLFGGSFNPIHNAHLIMANWVKEEFSLDKIIFIPNYRSPLKDNYYGVNEKQRLNMIYLATSDNPDFEVSRYEVEREEVSYSIDTIKHFINDDNEYYFIIGGDSLRSITKWKEYEQIFKLVRVICVDRDVKSSRNGDVLFSSMPLIDISSTMIRSRVAQNLSVKYLLPNSVIDYIEKEKLYEKKTD